MYLRRFAVLAFVAAISVPGWATVSFPGPRDLRSHVSLAAREQELWASATHNSEFGNVLHATAPPNCEMVQPPQALATPNPVLDNMQSNDTITVTFIIGTDGMVHSPLILRSIGASEDRVVLHTIESWRYRPATCNGIPTESEGKVLFSGR